MFRNRKFPSIEGSARKSQRLLGEQLQAPVMNLFSLGKKVFSVTQKVVYGRLPLTKIRQSRFNPIPRRHVCRMPAIDSVKGLGNSYLTVCSQPQPKFHVTAMR